MTENRIQATADMQLSGTLAFDAELRNRVLDGDGHTVPVICLQLIGTGPAHMPVHIEWPQPADGHQAAEKLIKTLRRGISVTLKAPLHSMRLVASNAYDVHASAQLTYTRPLTKE